MHRIISMALNVAQLFFLVFVVYPPDSGRLTTLSFLGLLAVPLVTMPYLYESAGPKSWLGLFLERKRLEEQKRIDALK